MTRTEIRFLQACIAAGSSAASAVRAEMEARGAVRRFQGAFQLADSFGFDRESLGGRMIVTSYLAGLPSTVVAEA